MARDALCVPRTPLSVLPGAACLFKCFTHARDYQIAPNLARRRPVRAVALILDGPRNDVYACSLAAVAAGYAAIA